MGHVKKGANPETMVLLYKSLIRSVIEYGIPIYFNGNKKNKEKIEKIQNAGIRTAMGYRISTPINVMMVEAGVMDLTNRIKLITNKYVGKLRRKRESEVLDTIMEQRVEREEEGDEIQELRRAYRDTEEIEEVMEKETDEERMETGEGGEEDREEEEEENEERWKKLMDWEMGKRWKEMEETRGRVNLIREIKEKLEINKQETIEIYTDGSKIPNSRANGVGIIIKNTNIGREEWSNRGISISNMATIFTTEAVALEKAIEIVKNEMENKDVIIFTDALSVLQGIKNIRKKEKSISDEDKRIRRIRNAIIKRDKQNRESAEREEERIGYLKIAWVPAHSGIEGNERADANAKELTEGVPAREVKIPWRDIKVNLEEKEWRESKEEMERIGEEKGVKYFSRRENNIGNRRPWFVEMIGMERRNISYLNRIRANHYNLAESLHRKRMVESPDCECGRGIEDINHIFWECDKYIGERVRLQMSMGSVGIKEGEDIAEAIRGDRRKIAKVIVGYLNRIKRDI